MHAGRYANISRRTAVLNEMNKRLEKELSEIDFKEIAGKNRSSDSVSLDLELYDGRNTVLGYADVLWHSSKPHIISPSGFVMCPDKPEHVALTAEFTFQDYPGIKGTHVFEITAVPGAAVRENKISTAPVRIFIAGDSTACNYPHTGEANRYPQTGWGQVFGELFDSTIGVVNCARSGRSSKSFLKEENFTIIQNNIKSGDYLFIQFAHNDCKADDANRYTSPDDGSYSSYIGKYIETAKNAGAQPVLCTPVTRNILNDNSLLPYAEELKRISQNEHITLLDIYSVTNALLKRDGESGREWMYMHIMPHDKRFIHYKDFCRSQYYECERHDNTHLNINGAHAVAEIAAKELARAAHPLAYHLK